MKKVVTVGLALLLVIGVSSLVLAHGPGFRGGHGWGPGYGMGPGAMHGGYGYGMGPGWGARGYGHPCRAWGGQEFGEKLTKDNVKSFLENRLAYRANPNLIDWPTEQIQTSRWARLLRRTNILRVRL